MNHMLLLLTLVCGGLLCHPIMGHTPQSDVAEAPNHERYSGDAYQAGRQEAEKDVRESRLVIEMFGLPTPWDGDYAKLLEQRYRIQIRRVAGCLVDEKIVGHAKGYNEVSEAEIARLFGANVLDRTQAEAKAHWQANHAN
jgi:hypothetical protein